MCTHKQTHEWAHTQNENTCFHFGGSHRKTVLLLVVRWIELISVSQLAAHFGFASNCCGCIPADDFGHDGWTAWVNPTFYVYFAPPAPNLSVNRKTLGENTLDCFWTSHMKRADVSVINIARLTRLSACNKAFGLLKSHFVDSQTSVVSKPVTFLIVFWRENSALGD